MKSILLQNIEITHKIESGARKTHENSYTMDNAIEITITKTTADVFIFGD